MELTPRSITARENSGELWVNLHRVGIGLALAATAGAGFFLASRSRAEPLRSDGKKTRDPWHKRAA